MSRHRGGRGAGDPAGSRSDATETSISTGASTGAAADGDLVVEARDLTLRFGGVTSLDGVSLTHRRGEILAVIGPNGAGKTSLFNCLTGAYRPQQGAVTFWPRPDRPAAIVGRTPHSITKLGVARTFQNIRLFPALSALENVQVGTEMRQRNGAVAAILGTPGARRAERDGVNRALELLELVGLSHRVNELATSLPYGEQRRLEIARALGTSPTLLLLDEPAAGTNPVEKRDLAELIKKISGLGVSVLIIEHDMRLVMSVAASVLVLNFGRVIAHGTPAEVQHDPAVVEAYLGAESDHSADPDPTGSSLPGPAGAAGTGTVAGAAGKDLR